MSDQDLLRRNIASRLRMARELAGLTQGQVAKRLRYHRPTVSEIEAGRRRVTAEELTMFCELYGVNVHWITGEDTQDTASFKAKLAARELDKLKDEDLDRLLQLIQSLKTSEDPSDK